MSYPKTKEEWWKFVEENVNTLQNLIARYHPYYKNLHLGHKISAETAERVCKQVRKQIAEETVEDPQVSFRKFVEARDEKLVNLLNEVWFGMPESMSYREAPGFGLLCDLCSEAWVLNDECKIDKED